MPRIVTGTSGDLNRKTLEATRERLGLSKVELCRRIGIRTEAYNRFLRGAAIPESVQRSVRSMCHDGAPDIWT